MEAGVHPVPGPTDSGGDQTTVRVAGLGVLDLDDVGTPLVEDGAGHGDEHVRGDLHDADAGERPGHGDGRAAAPAPAELTASAALTPPRLRRFLDPVEAGRVLPEDLPADARVDVPKAGRDRLLDVLEQAGRVREVGLEEHVVGRDHVEEVLRRHRLEPVRHVHALAEQLRGQHITRFDARGRAGTLPTSCSPSPPT